MKKLAIFIVLAFVLMLCATPVYAQLALPHAFYGSVTIDGSPAPAGTKVEARGEGVATGIDGNPTTTTVRGIYGTSNPFESRLVVQGDIDDGATITFYVNGYSTGQTAEWHEGKTTALDLSVIIKGIPPPSVTGPSAIRAYVETTLFGVEEEFRISDEGEILETIEATSADGMLTITIPKGTIALDEEGEPLSSLTVDVDPSPPDPPEDANIIGLAYDFGPEEATFDPAITFTWNYDPDELPEDVAEEDLVIAYYDEDVGEWVELPCEVDRPPLTASVRHFTTFAIITRVVPPPPAPAAFTVSALTIQPVEVHPEETVTITVSVANTGGTEGSYTVTLLVNGIKDTEKSVTVAAGASHLVSFAVAKEKAGSYSVVVDGLSGSFMVAAPPVPPPPPAPAPAPPPVKPPINWPLIGGVIAAAIVVALLIFFLVMVRRRAY